MAKPATVTQIDSATAMEWVDVTPEWAQRALERMPQNRSVSQPWVNTLADMMRRGEWDSSLGDPIRFSDEGHLVDGQHRLWAVIESGVTIRALILRGLKQEALMTLDYGRKRTLADFLHLSGESSARPLAAALGALWTYREVGEFVPKTYLHKSLTVPTAKALLEKNPGLRASITAVHALNGRLRGGQGRWAAIHYILTEIDTADAEEFFNRLHDGEGLPPGSPITVLRNRLMDDRTRLIRLSARDFTALVLKAWNLWRDGATIEVLSFRAGGRNPETYPAPR